MYALKNDIPFEAKVNTSLCKLAGLLYVKEADFISENFYVYVEIRACTMHIGHKDEHYIEKHVFFLCH